MEGKWKLSQCSGLRVYGFQGLEVGVQCLPGTSLTDGFTV